ncbi:MAG: AAA family ATPase [Candidatus Heimdallarchaeota archaeon]
MERNQLPFPFISTIEKEVPPESLVISCGLPGTWKTPVTEQVAEMKGLQILRTDLIRLGVFKGQDIFDNQVASSMKNRMKVYNEMLRQAEEATAPGVLLDATFVTQDLRRRAAAIAHKKRLPFIILEMVCSEEVSLRRIAKRTKEDYESNALTKQAYDNNKKIFEPVALEALGQNLDGLQITHLQVDTEHNPPEKWTIKRVVKH